MDMLFVIGCIFAVLGLFITFFGITIKSFTDNRRHTRILMFASSLFFGIALICAFFQNRDASKKNKLQYDTIVNDSVKIDNLTIIDSISKNKIESLSSQLSVADKTIRDTVKFCSQNGINQTKLTEKNIRDAVAQGVKTGIAEARADKDDLKRTIKDSIDKLLPDLNLITDKDPLYKENKDTSKFSVFFGVRNSGNGRAVNVRILYAPIFELKPEYRELHGKYSATEEKSLSDILMDVPGNNGAKGMPVTIPQYDQILHDWVFFRVRVFWESSFGKKFNSTQIWRYSFNSGEFVEIGHTEKKLTDVIAKIPSP